MQRVYHFYLLFQCCSLPCLCQEKKMHFIKPAVGNTAVGDELRYCGSRYSDLLRAGRFEGRILVGSRFSASFQTDRGAQPTPYRVGTGSFLGVKWPGRDVATYPI